jgi:hypothetical protein
MSNKKTIYLRKQKSVVFVASRCSQYVINFRYNIGTGYQYDRKVFVAWVLQVRRVEAVTKLSTGFRTWTPILRKFVWKRSSLFRCFGQFFSYVICFYGNLFTVNHFWQNKVVLTYGHPSCLHIVFLLDIYYCDTIKLKEKKYTYICVYIFNLRITIYNMMFANSRVSPSLQRTLIDLYWKKHFYLV